MSKEVKVLNLPFCCAAGFLFDFSGMGLGRTHYAPSNSYAFLETKEEIKESIIKAIREGGDSSYYFGITNENQKEAEKALRSLGAVIILRFGSSKKRLCHLRMWVLDEKNEKFLMKLPAERV